MAMILVGAHLVVSRSLAQTTASPIVWRGPNDCQRQAAVDARFRALVPETDQVRGLAAEARVAQALPRSWHLDLVLSYRGRAARRRVQGRSCDDLVEATAVLLALAVTAEVPDSGEKPGAPAVSTPEPSPKSLPVPRVHEPSARASKQRAHRPPLGVQLDGGFALDAGRVGFWGFGAALGWYEEHWSLAFGARIWPSTERVNLLATPGASVRVGIRELDLTGCLDAGGQRARLLGCGALSMDRYAVQTAGITVPAQVTAWSPSVHLGGGLLFPLSTRAFVALLVDAKIQAPQAFVVRGIEQVAYRAAAFGGSTRVSLGAHF